MLRSYLDKRNRWVIQVTFASEHVRTYGPIIGKREAQAFMTSRLVANSSTSPRAQDILDARIRRQRQYADRPAHDLVGVRLRLP